MLRVVVAGGSLGGLSAALALRDAGCDVTVHERASRALEGRGAGIVLHPATVRHLVGPGGAEPAALGPPAHEVRYVDRGGVVVHRQPVGWRFASYGLLHRRLLALLEPDRYLLGRELVDLEQDAAGVTARFADGEEVRCDLLVGADGIHSTCRRSLLPGHEPRYAGYVAWRGLVPLSRLAEPVAALVDDVYSIFLPERSHILAYAVDSADGERLANWVWYRNVAEGAELERLLTAADGAARPLALGAGEVAPERAAELRDAAHRLLPAAFAGLVDLTEEPFLQAVVDLEVPRMAFGRACLIGDAAFVARPHAGAGTAKAADDGWSLARAIAEAGGDVTAALARWEPGRLELARSVVARARAGGERSQRDGTWRVGDLPPVGLRAVGDSGIG